MPIHTIARIARTLSLGIWLGGIVMAFIFAPIVFKHLAKDRFMAGNINAEMFHIAGQVKIVLALIALAAEGMIFYSKAPGAPERSARRFVTAGCLVAALAIALFIFAYLQPAMMDVRDRISDFSEAAADSPERGQFRKLHGASMALGLLEGILVLVAMIVGLL